MPQETRAALLKMVRDVVTFIDAKRTLESIDDYLFTVESMIDNHPTMKLEEFHLVFIGMKQGEYGHFYERLKTPQILECCCKYEALRAEILERLNRAPVTRGLRDDQSVIPHEIEKLTDVIRRRSNVYKNK